MFCYVSGVIGTGENAVSKTDKNLTKWTKNQFCEAHSSEQDKLERVYIVYLLKCSGEKHSRGRAKEVLVEQDGVAFSIS